MKTLLLTKPQRDLAEQLSKMIAEEHMDPGSAIVTLRNWLDHNVAMYDEHFDPPHAGVTESTKGG